MKKPTPPKLTKRQRKALQPSNAAVKQSLKHGSRTMVAGVTYCGENPNFAPIEDPQTKMITGYYKVSKGIPFVRAEPKHRYVA